MLSVKSIINRFVFIMLGLFTFSFLHAQENAPFSRYALGDPYPSQNIATRAMGGVSAAFADGQAINTVNPASYGELRFIQSGSTKGGLVTYDFGLSIDARALHSASPVNKYNSTNFIPSYIQIGIPLSTKHLGLVFGLRPATRINYSIQTTQPSGISGFDSLYTLYEGNGGISQVFLGLGKRWGHFSIGFNGGYEFGHKDISTKVTPLNDTVNYYKSNSASNTNFWGVFLNPGISYYIKLNERTNNTTHLKESYLLQLGGSGTLEHHLKANTDILRQTFNYDANGGVLQIDSVLHQTNVLGTINLPLTYNAGFILAKTVSNPFFLANKWTIGADYTAGKWTDYRFYNQPDRLIDNWIIHAGASLTPDPGSTKFWSRATYRAGFYTGKDFINADGNEYKVTAFTFGGGFNLRKFRAYDNQFTLINTAIEIGRRGSSVNNVTENFFKLSVGLSLSDIWFIKRKYD